MCSAGRGKVCGVVWGPREVWNLRARFPARPRVVCRAGRARGRVTHRVCGRRACRLHTVRARGAGAARSLAIPRVVRRAGHAVRNPGAHRRISAVADVGVVGLVGEELASPIFWFVVAARRRRGGRLPLAVCGAGSLSFRSNIHAGDALAKTVAATALFVFVQSHEG